MDHDQGTGRSLGHEIDEEREGCASRGPASGRSPRTRAEYDRLIGFWVVLAVRTTSETIFCSLAS